MRTVNVLMARVVTTAVAASQVVLLTGVARTVSARPVSSSVRSRRTEVTTKPHEMTAMNTKM